MFSGSHFIFTNGATVWKIADASCTEACANIGLTCSESELAALTGQAAALAAFRAAGITCKGVNDWDYGHGISQCTDPGCCLGACIGACSVPKTKVPGACVLLLDWFSRLAICNTMLPNNATHFAPNVINTRFRHMPHRLCTACTFYVLTYTVTLCGLHKKKFNLDARTQGCHVSSRNTDHHSRLCPCIGTYVWTRKIWAFYGLASAASLT